MRAKSVFFHILILATIAGTATLGVWQLHRREWKESLITTYETAQKTAPKVWHKNIAPSQAWWRLSVLGTVNYKRAIFIPAYVTEDEKICGETGWGFRVVAPVTLSNGQTLIYHEGFVPKSALNRLPHKSLDRFLSVTVWPLHPPAWFPPHNDLERHEWIALDQSLAKVWNLPPQEIYLNSDVSGRLMTKTDNPTCDYPINYWRTPELPNNHLQYAVTWFALAAVLTGLYIYRAWSNRKPSKKTPSRDIS